MGASLLAQGRNLRRQGPTHSSKFNMALRTENIISDQAERTHFDIANASLPMGFKRCVGPAARCGRQRGRGCHSRVSRLKHGSVRQYLPLPVLHCSIFVSTEGTYYLLCELQFFRFPKCFDQNSLRMSLAFKSYVTDAA
jgi:hypothetical protein